MLSNAEIAEKLAREAEHAKQPLQRALRRASRRALLWPEEVTNLCSRGSVTQLSGIGPYLDRLISQWLSDFPETVHPPEIRQDFTLAALTTNAGVLLTVADFYVREHALFVPQDCVRALNLSDHQKALQLMKNSYGANTTVSSRIPLSRLSKAHREGH